MITRESTLVEVAFEVCSALDAAGFVAVLVGGSAATYYAPAAYQSYDLDFVCSFDVDRRSERAILSILSQLGYSVTSGRIEHATNPFMIDFPPGPLFIADDEREASYETVRNGEAVLRVISPYDCVRDRLAKYIYWNDASALGAAVAVAINSRDRIDMANLQRWAGATDQADPRGGLDARRKFGDFVQRLKAGG